MAEDAAGSGGRALGRAHLRGDHPAGATSGFGAALRVILGSATADLVLLLPALASVWAIRSLARGALWVKVSGRWAFWKGVAGNLANPLTWTFWLATGTPAMLAAQRAGGTAGLVLFTAVWFLVASGLEAVIALAVARSGRRVGPRGRPGSPASPRWRSCAWP